LLDVERAENEHGDREQDCSDVFKGKDLASHLIAHLATHLPKNNTDNAKLNLISKS
jgi:hypothetical protein